MFRISLLLLSILLAGCVSTLAPRQPFDTAWRGFEQRLRWQDYQGASRFLIPEHRQGFVDRFTALDDLHITDVRMESAEYDPESKEMTVRARLEYYLLPSPAVRTLPFEQMWIYRDPEGLDGGLWLARTPFPPLPR